MKVVFDTSAIIYLSDFSQFEEIVLPKKVLEEVKDKFSKLKISSLNAKVLEVDEKELEEVKKIAKETGDLPKLSQADLEVLALAKRLNYTIISDDHNIQNLAKKMGLKFLSIFNPAIKKFIKWKKFCKMCKKFYENDKEVCEICGSKLIRVPY